MRWIFRLIGILAALIVIVVIGVSLVPAERIAELATREVSRQTGRELTIKGGVKPVFFPVIGVKTGPMTLANAEWSDQGPMIEAAEMLVGVELMPLLRGNVKIKEFRIENPVIRLEKGRNGKANWELATLSEPVSDDPASGASSSVAAITLEDGRINNGQISYRDAATGETFVAEDVNIALAAPEFNGAARVSAELTYRQVPLAFEAELARLDTFLTGAVTGLDLRMNAAFGTLELKGEGGFQPLQATGAINLDVTDLPGALRLAGTETASLGRKASASGQLTFTSEGQAFLRGARLQLDQNVLQGDIDYKPGNRAKITALLDGGDLALPKGAGSTGGTNAPEADGWSKTPIDASALNLVDADVVFRARSLDLGSARLGATALRAKLDSGRLVIALNDVNAYGGKIAGEYVINARRGLSMGGKISALGVKLQPLLVDMAEYDRLIATADLRFSFLVSGNSMFQMMNSLSGDGSVSIGGGELLGLDIAGMLRNLDASYRGAGQKTIFVAITGSFTMKEGVLFNEDLKYTSELVDATGKGTVGIGARRVDYRLVPVAFAKRGLVDAGGVSVPVKIQGPWSRISYSPDLQSLFDAELDKQKKEAEEKLRGDVERAKKEAREKLQGDVDRAVEEGKQKLIDGILERLSGE